MSDLERNHPEWHEFLMWHDQVISKYSGPIRTQLRIKAREYLSKNIKYEQG